MNTCTDDKLYGATKAGTNSNARQSSCCSAKRETTTRAASRTRPRLLWLATSRILGTPYREKSSCALVASCQDIKAAAKKDWMFGGCLPVLVIGCATDLAAKDRPKREANYCVSRCPTLQLKHHFTARSTWQTGSLGLRCWRFVRCESVLPSP